MGHETDSGPHHDLFDGFVPRTPSTDEYLGQAKQSESFSRELEVYSANKESIDATFGGQYIVMTKDGKIVANSPRLLEITRYVDKYFPEATKFDPTWTPKIPLHSGPRDLGGVVLGKDPTKR